MQPDLREIISIFDLIDKFSLIRDYTINVIENNVPTQ